MDIVTLLPKCGDDTGYGRDGDPDSRRKRRGRILSRLDQTEHFFDPFVDF
jgi:hypothetical protein